jgi:hypothetical protein
MEKNGKMILAQGTRFLPPRNPQGRQNGLGQVKQLLWVQLRGLKSYSL